MEAFKTYEKKPADLIKEKVDKADQKASYMAAVCTAKSVNKTDAATLAYTFASFARMAQATENELEDCPGFGQKKVKRIFQAFNQPFVSSTTSATYRTAASSSTSSAVTVSQNKPLTSNSRLK